MCLGVPGEVVEMDGDTVLVDVGGTRRRASLMLLDAEGVGLTPGDYVIVHAGFAIQKVDEQAALETLRLMKDIS